MAADEETTVRALIEGASVDRRILEILALRFGFDTGNDGPIRDDPSKGSALRELIRSRKALLDAVARLTPEQLVEAPLGVESVKKLLEVRSRADVAAAEAIEARGSRGTDDAVGELLIEALRAARKELLTTLALVPEVQRPRLRLRGGRALVDVLAEMTALDRRLLAAVSVDPGEPQAAQRREWSLVWSALHRTRQCLLVALQRALLEGANRGDERANTAREIVRLIDQDRELADDIRRS